MSSPKSSSPHGPLFVLRDAQIEEIQSHRIEAAIEEAMALLIEDYPEELGSLNPSEQRKFVRLGIAEAHRYGLTSRSLTFLYLGLRCEFGPGFDRHPKIRSILVNPLCSPAKRLEELLIAADGHLRTELAGCTNGPSTGA